MYNVKVGEKGVKDIGWQDIMPVSARADTQQADLRVKIDEAYRGIKDLDFFADHTRIQINREINLISGKLCVPVDELYLRTVLTSISCPHCQHPVKRSYRKHPREWLLKFTGRKILYCTNCDWRDTVKMNRWEWEIIATALITFSIVAGASLHWILH